MSTPDSQRPHELYEYAPVPELDIEVIRTEAARLVAALTDKLATHRDTEAARRAKDPHNLYAAGRHDILYSVVDLLEELWFELCRKPGQEEEGAG